MLALRASPRGELRAAQPTVPMVREVANTSPAVVRLVFFGVSVRLRSKARDVYGIEWSKSFVSHFRAYYKL